MNDIVFNPRQAEFISKIKHDQLKRINILEGAVRSGKTWVSTIGWGLWVATQPKEYPYLMAARTLETLKRNILIPMQDMFGDRAFQFSANQKTGRLFGRTVFLEGADNAMSEGKIRGTTYGGVYADELTMLDRNFFAMALSRISPPGAKLFGTTNPDSPNHWLKVNYLDRENELSLLRMKFSFDDNPHLANESPEYFEQMKHEYVGVYYRRFILGEWCAAEGAVYPQFDAQKHVVDTLPEVALYWVGVDYGHSNPTVFILGGLGVDGKLYIVAEDVHKAADEGDQSPREYSAAMIRFLQKHVAGKPLDSIVVDPSAKGFINQLRADGVAHIRGADNEVLRGIQLVSSLISADLFRIHRSCAVTIAEMQGYVWDSKAQERGEDKPVKMNDHCLDAARYMCMKEKTYWKGRLAHG